MATELWQQKIDKKYDNFKWETKIPKLAEIDDDEIKEMMKLETNVYKNNKFFEFAGEKIKCDNIVRKYGQTFFRREKKNGELGQPNQIMIANVIMAEYHIININDILYIYYNGIYVSGNFCKKLITNEANNVLGVDTSTYRLKEIFNHIGNNTSYEYEKIVENQKKYINFKNGLLDFHTMKLLPHNPEIPSVVQIGCNYDPSAKCTIISDFLSDALEEIYIRPLLQAMSLCLIPISPTHYNILQGSGGNGKSVIQNLIRKLIGNNNCTSISIHDISRKPFAAYELYMKQVVLHGDIPSTEIESSSVIKELTGGDDITADRKFLSSITFKNLAQLFFNANKIPYIKNLTDADFDRMNIIIFRKKYRGTEKQDPNFSQKVTSEEELSGLVNMLIPLLKQYLKVGRIEKPYNREILEDIYYGNTMSISTFFEECITVYEDNELKRDHAYMLYSAFCDYYTAPKIPKRAFGNAMKKQGYDGNSKGRMEKRTWHDIKIELPNYIINYMVEKGIIEKGQPEYSLYKGRNGLYEQKTRKSNLLSF